METRPIKYSKTRLHNRKNSSVATHVCYQKITVQKRQKVMTSYVLHCFCSYCTKKYSILALSRRTAPCRAEQCWRQDQKDKTKTDLRSVLSRLPCGLRPQD